MTKPSDFREIIELWDDPAEMAKDLGTSPGHIRVMASRNSIAPQFWRRLIDSAKRRNIPDVSFELLAKLAEEKAA